MLIAAKVNSIACDMLSKSLPPSFWHLLVLAVAGVGTCDICLLLAESCSAGAGSEVDTFADGRVSSPLSDEL